MHNYMDIYMIHNKPNLLNVKLLRVSSFKLNITSSVSYYFKLYGLSKSDN